MNLLPFLHDITVQLIGEQYCPHCGVEDLFFAYEGKCAECKKEIHKKQTVDQFIYSLSVLFEFISKYDEIMPTMHKAVILNEINKDIVHTKAT